jgi:ankyrin repeat protein
MSLSNLPTEIICMIGERIPSQADVKAFKMSHQRVYAIPQVQTALYNTTHESRLNNSLLWACEKNNLDLVRAMLRLGADVKCNDDTKYHTPLTFAAAEGHAQIVKFLLEHDPSIVNEEAECGDTALKRAIRKGHLEVVKILLTRPDLDPFPIPHGPDIDVLHHGPYNEMPINDALFRGNEEIVRLLMADGRFKLDHQSLASASKGGNTNLVQLCLQEAPRNAQYWTQCPFYCAASQRKEGVMKILLGDSKLNPNKGQNDGWTPLGVAAFMGYDNIVRMLLGRNDVIPDVKDHCQRTPFFKASMNSRMGVMDLLLASGKVDPDSRDFLLRTPLSYAAEKGDLAVLSFLLATGKVDPESRCEQGRTPLSHAAYNGLPDTVRVLLETGRVNPNSMDEDGRTPLSLAAGSSHDLHKFSLSRRKGLQQNFRRNSTLRPKMDCLETSPTMESPPKMAAGLPTQYDQLGTIEQLLACDQVYPDIPDYMGKTPLMWAAQRGHIDAAELLIATGKVDPNRRDNDGWTAATYAEKGKKASKASS